ncbi:hypothetical protein EBZ39_15990 [bacterium]|nr:hypothetical protein [bacterium]
MIVLQVFDQFEQVSNKIFSFQTKQAIVDYLDQLESESIETPYGDVIYEHAYELAQVRLQQVNS